MAKRLNKLANSDGALNQFIQKQREKKEFALRLSKDEQGTLENAVSNVDILKSKVKREMVQARVVDLKALKEHQQAKVEDNMKAGQEKINFLIVKAKEEVNEAVKMLFSKDSKFHQVRALKDQQPVATETQDLSKVQIGSLKISGPVPNLKDLKSLTLTSDLLKDLKRHVALFASSN